MVFFNTVTTNNYRSNLTLASSFSFANLIPEAIETLPSKDRLRGLVDVNAGFADDPESAIRAMLSRNLLIVRQKGQQCLGQAIAYAVDVRDDRHYNIPTSETGTTTQLQPSALNLTSGALNDFEFSDLTKNAFNKVVMRINEIKRSEQTVIGMMSASQENPETGVASLAPAIANILASSGVFSPEEYAKMREVNRAAAGLPPR